MSLFFYPLYVQDLLKAEDDIYIYIYIYFCMINIRWNLKYTHRKIKHKQIGWK